MTVHTTTSLRRSARRLERRTERKHLRAARAQRVIAAMRDEGATLHRDHGNGRVIWWLSNGIGLTHEMAVDVLGDVHVVGVGDCLFEGTPSQTWRYLEDAHG